jgi:hypothetical protein
MNVLEIPKAAFRTAFSRLHFRTSDTATAFGRSRSIFDRVLTGGPRT